MALPARVAGGGGTFLEGGREDEAGGGLGSSSQRRGDLHRPSRRFAVTGELVLAANSTLRAVP